MCHPIEIRNEKTYSSTKFIYEIASNNRFFMNDDDEDDDDNDELFLWNHIFEITEYIYIADVYFDQEKL